MYSCLHPPFIGDFIFKDSPQRRLPATLEFGGRFLDRAVAFNDSIVKTVPFSFVLARDRTLDGDLTRPHVDNDVVWMR
jgi:hypothetical protein